MISYQCKRWVLKTNSRISFLIFFPPIFPPTPQFHDNHVFPSMHPPPRVPLSPHFETLWHPLAVVPTPCRRHTTVSPTPLSTPSAFTSTNVKLHSSFLYLFIFPFLLQQAHLWCCRQKLHRSTTVTNWKGNSTLVGLKNESFNGLWAFL